MCISNPSISVEDAIWDTLPLFVYTYKMHVSVAVTTKKTIMIRIRKDENDDNNDDDDVVSRRDYLLTLFLSQVNTNRRAWTKLFIGGYIAE